VLLGDAVAAGLPVADLFAEFHASNMTKEAGRTLWQGKGIKGDISTARHPPRPEQKSPTTLTRWRCGFPGEAAGCGRLEFEVVVFIWHPLAGLPEADGFHLDPGRLCVLLTRHRQACVVVGRAGDCRLVEEQVPPATEAYLGCDADPVLDGWEVHREVFHELAALKVSL
jgi:hypothetical protein